MKTLPPNPAMDKFINGLSKLLKEAYSAEVTGADIVAALDNLKFAIQMQIWEEMNSVGKN